MKTLVILSHPNFAASRVNKALSRVAKAAADVEVRHLEGFYGSDVARIDARAEQEALVRRLANTPNRARSAIAWTKF